MGAPPDGPVETPEAWGLYKELSLMGWTIPIWEGGLMDQPWLLWQEIMICAAEDARMTDEKAQAAKAMRERSGKAV